jgi:hypothetical protein
MQSGMSKSGATTGRSLLSDQGFVVEVSVNSRTAADRLAARHGARPPVPLHNHPVQTSRNTVDLGVSSTMPE